MIRIDGLRYGLGAAGRQLCCQRGIDVPNSFSPNPRLTDWAQWDAFPTHALSLLECAADAGIETLASTRLARELGACYCHSGRDAEAHPLWRRRHNVSAGPADGTGGGRSRTPSRRCRSAARDCAISADRASVVQPAA